MRIYIKHFKIRNFYSLHLKFISHLDYHIPNGLYYPIRAIGPNLFNAFSSVGVRQKVFVIKNELAFYYKNIDILLFVVKDSLENVWDHLLVKIQYLFHPLSSELAFASYALNLFLSNTRMQCLINMNCKQLSIQNFTSICDSVDEFGRLKVNQYIWHEEMG